MRYIKVFFKLITWSNEGGSGSCYVYTSNPGFSATANNGSSSSQFSVSVRSSDSSSTSEGSVTMWLSQFNEATMKRESLSPDEAQLYQQVYGSVAYLAITDDNQMSLMKTSDIPADELSSNTVASFLV